MADRQYANAPQSFTFDGKSLMGTLVSWSGQQPRRHVVHQYVKRRGARVEDMEQGPRTFAARLHFIGPNCARDYNDFRASVADKPLALLQHPIAGSWQAFCEGPDETVDFARSTNEIQVNCKWIEAELDAKTPRDVPSLATAAQDATTWRDKMEQGVALYQGETAKASTFQASSLAVIDETINAVQSSTSPILDMTASLQSLGGITSGVVGALNDAGERAQVFSQAVTNFVDSTDDLFTGDDPASGAADSSATLLGVAAEEAELTVEALIAADVSSAGSAEAVGSVYDALSACYVLDEALKASRPSTILIVVAESTDLISLCVQRAYIKPLEAASTIMTLNRIQNPASIAAGTRLRVPIA